MTDKLPASLLEAGDEPERLIVAIALAEALSREADAANAAWEADKSRAALSRLFSAEAEAINALRLAWCLREGIEE